MKTATAGVSILCATALIVGFGLCSAARADFRINEKRDTVVLDDGERVVGTIVAATKDGVLIVVIAQKEGEDGAEQRFIPQARIKEIIRGKSGKTVEGYTTGEKDAKKVVVGVGFTSPNTKKEEPPADGSAPKGPSGPTGPWMPLNPTAPTTNPNAATQGLFPAQALTDMYAVRFPQLTQAAGLLMGGQGAQKFLEAAQKGDPAAEKQAASVLDKLVGARDEPEEDAPKTEAVPDKDPTADRRDKMREERRKLLEERRKQKTDGAPEEKVQGKPEGHAAE